MLSSALFVGAILAARQSPSLQSFTHPDSGLVFSHPAWTIRRNRATTTFTIPLANGESATLELIGLVYSGTVEAYQLGQIDVAKQLKREVVRQWQEEILSVPLLMTQSQWTEPRGVDRVPTLIQAESGLIYSQTPRKMVFRLTASQTNFSEANGLWRRAMQTLRTDDGSDLRPFDPNARPTPAELDALRAAPRRTIWREPETRTVRTETPKNALTGTAAGRNFTLLYPDGWSYESESGFHRFRSGTNGPTDVLIEGLSSLDSPAPGRTMIQLAGRSLPRFKSVQRREEPVPFRSRAGMTVSYVYREGVMSDGTPLITLEAVGASEGNEYWSLRWESRDRGQARRAKGRLMDLIQRLRIQPAAS